jgi:hypothetical protein
MSPVENGRWALQELIQPVSLLSHPVGRGNVAVAGHDRRPRTVKAHEFTIALNKPQNPLLAQLGTPTLTSGMSF